MKEYIEWILLSVGLHLESSTLRFNGPFSQSTHCPVTTLKHVKNVRGSRQTSCPVRILQSDVCYSRDGCDLGTYLSSLHVSHTKEPIIMAYSMQHISRRQMMRVKQRLQCNIIAPHHSLLGHWPQTHAK